VLVQAISHQIHSKEHTGQLVLCWNLRQGNGTLNIWLLIDSFKKFYYKKKLCIKEYLNKACKIRALVTV